MDHYYWNDWYAGWGWFLWFGVFILIFSSFGNWGYTYSAHRRVNGYPQKNAIDILNERYANGEIDHDQYMKMKSQILQTASSDAKNRNAQTASSSLTPSY